MGIPQRVIDKTIDTAIKGILNGERENKIKLEIAAQISRDPSNSQVEKIYKEARKKSGIDYKAYEPSNENTTVREAQIKELITTAIDKIREGKDNEDVINDTEDRLRRLKISEGNIKNYLDQIYDYFDYSMKKEDNDEFLLKEGEELLPLPRLDIGFDELKDINLPDDEDESVLPDIDKDMLTSRNIDMAREYENLPNDEQKQKFTDGIFRSKGKLVQETKKLEDYIRQVKLCAITLPIAISKLRMEDILVKLFVRIEDKFRNIYVFGWEKQINSEYYKSFDELFKMNDENEGALFIIRDLKTFNVYASDLFKFGITRNYFIVLVDGLVSGEDLAPLDNLTNGEMFLWPAFLSLKVIPRLVPTKTIIYGKHAKAYLDAIANSFPKPLGKESWKSMEADPSVINIGKKVLTLDLTREDVSGRSLGTNLIGLTNPPLNLEEAISRSPKFRDIIISIFANAGERILVKLLPGQSGLEGFIYIYEKLKKTPINPTIIRRTDDYVSKKGKIKSIPDLGPCLVITDFTLSDQLIPKNIDKFYISGGGEKEDIETIFDMSKSLNYTRNKYPRYIEVKNFITVLESNVPVTIDLVEYEAFAEMLEKTRENMEKIRTASVQIISLPGDRLGVREKDF